MKREMILSAYAKYADALEAEARAWRNSIAAERDGSRADVIDASDALVCAVERRRGESTTVYRLIALAGAEVLAREAGK